MSDIINGIITAFFSIVSAIINFVISPIDQFILNNIPGLSDLINLIGDFFEYIGSMIPWAISYFGLYPGIINQIIIVITFKITLILFDDGVKFAVKWYDKLKV